LAAVPIIVTAWRIRSPGLYAVPLLPMPAAPTTQHPFDLNKAQTECVDWQLTSARMTNAANFLDANQPYPLKSCPWRRCVPDRNSCTA